MEKRGKKDYNETKPQLRQGSWRTAVLCKTALVETACL